MLTTSTGGGVVATGFDIEVDVDNVVADVVADVVAFVVEEISEIVVTGDGQEIGAGAEAPGHGLN